MLGTLLSVLLVRGLALIYQCLLTSRCQQSQRFTEIILKYPKDDAITLRSVFSTRNTALDTLPLSIILYYELLIIVINHSTAYSISTTVVAI